MTRSGHYWRNYLLEEAQRSNPRVRGIDEATWRQMNEDDYAKAISERESSTSVYNGRSVYWTTILFSGAVLLCFGRLDVAAEVIRNRPDETMPFRFMTGIVRDVIPIPACLGIDSQPEEVIAWIERHSDSLVWHEEAARFQLTP